MSIRWFALFCSLVFAGSARAQVEVLVEFEKEYYIADEPILAEVRVTNFSGRALDMGQGHSWLTVTVEARDGFLVRTKSPTLQPKKFKLENAEQASQWIDIATHFDVIKPGDYQVVATISIPALQIQAQCEPTEFNVISATRIWTQEFGVVAAGADGNAAPEVRRYTLLRGLNKDRFELYAKVTDRFETFTFNAFPIGILVSFGIPEVQIDRLNNLHVLLQYGPRAFRYVVVTPNGRLIIRQRYEYTNTRPKLDYDESGNIQVKGGGRVVRSSDLPKAVDDPTPLLEDAFKPNKTPTDGTGDDAQSTAQKLAVETPTSPNKS